MLFAFILVLFAGLAFMFLCLLRGQEKLAATLREELAATRSRLEALERRLASRAGQEQPAVPVPLSPEPFGADAPLELPADSVIRAAGVDLPATEPQFSFDAGGETAAWPSDARAEGRAVGHSDGLELRPADAERLELDRMPVDQLPGERFAGESFQGERLSADRLSMDRLDMRPPSPGRDAGRARDAGMPELKL